MKQYERERLKMQVIRHVLLAKTYSQREGINFNEVFFLLSNTPLFVNARHAWFIWCGT